IRAIEMSKFDDAVELLNRILKDNPRSARAYFYRAFSHERLGKRDKAIDDYSEAIKWDSSFPPSYNNRGILYHDRCDYVCAMKDFDRAMKLAPNYASAYNSRGNTHAAMANLELAVVDYSKAIE